MARTVTEQADTAERWARGEAGLDELAAAANATDHTYANVEPLVPLVSCATWAVDAAVATAAAGHETRWYDTRQGKEAANHAASFAAAGWTGQIRRGATRTRANQSMRPWHPICAHRSQPCCARICPAPRSLMRAVASMSCSKHKMRKTTESMITFA
jgi:hypothetical protein